MRGAERERERTEEESRREESSRGREGFEQPRDREKVMEQKNAALAGRGQGSGVPVSDTEPSGHAARVLHQRAHWRSLEVTGPRRGQLSAGEQGGDTHTSTGGGRRSYRGSTFGPH